MNVTVAVDTATSGKASRRGVEEIRGRLLITDTGVSDKALVDSALAPGAAPLALLGDTTVPAGEPRGLWVSVVERRDYLTDPPTIDQTPPLLVTFELNSSQVVYRLAVP